MATAAHTLVRRVIDEVWNRQRLTVADELFAPTYVNHGGLITDLVVGPEAIKTSVVLYRRAFPGLHIAIEAVTCIDGMAVLQWRARSMRPAAGGGVPAAGNMTGFAGVTRSRVEAGQIQESWTEWDQDDAFRRLGLVEMPEAPVSGQPERPS